MSVNSLPAAAALHIFLAQHPELWTFPISWTVTGQDGINCGLPHRDPDIPRVAELIAGALGVEVTGREFDLKEHGRVLGRYVRGQVGGVEFFFGGYAELEVS
ncbi:hypothetical protein ACWEO1_06400 [Kitasatospora cineracea]